MRTFLLQHVDALVTTAAGLWMTVYSWRHRGRLKSSPNKLVRLLPVLAPLVLIFGIVSFALDSRPAYVWRRAFTDDQRASAEFPCATTIETATDSAMGVSVRRFTVSCNIPHRDINLRLSYNEIPPEGAGLTAEQRIDAMISLLPQQGHSILSSAPDPHNSIPGHRLLTETNQGKSRCLIRIAITPNAIYRVVATSSSGFHDDPAIVRFVHSFSIQ